MPENEEYVSPTLEAASHFDMVLSVHVDGHIGFMENESFSYESVGKLLKCPLCNQGEEHPHAPVFAMIRHQFNDEGTWAIHGTTNEEAHMRAKQVVRSTPWHYIEPRTIQLPLWM